MTLIQFVFLRSDTALCYLEAKWRSVEAELRAAHSQIKSNSMPTFADLRVLYRLRFEGKRDFLTLS